MESFDNHIKKRLVSHKKLAQERTVLANERTTLAYIRTGFGAFVLGIALVKLFDNNANYVHAGYVAGIIGILLVVLGLIYYPARKKRILKH